MSENEVAVLQAEMRAVCRDLEKTQATQSKFFWFIATFIATSIVVSSAALIRVGQYMEKSERTQDAMTAMNADISSLNESVGKIQIDIALSAHHAPSAPQWLKPPDLNSSEETR